MRTLCYSFIGLLAVSGFLLAADETDILYLKDGRTIPAEGSGQTVRVVKEGFEEVVVRVKMGGQDGGTVSQSPSDILRIEHYDAPLELKQAMSAIRGRNFKKGLEMLDKVKDKPRPYVDVYILFYRAEALKGLGMSDKDKNKEAADAYKNLLTKYPDSIFKIQALLGDAETSVQAGDLDSARSKLKTIKTKLPGTKWESFADISLAKVEEKAGNYDKAVRLYRQTATLSTDPVIKVKGRLGEIRCLVHDKRYDDAERKARKILDETNDRGVMGSAWSIIGDCNFAQAGSDKEKARAALLAYLRVVVVYFNDSEVAAKSAYRAGKCFEMLGEKDRAREQYTRASQTAGGGDWQVKASEMIKG